MTTLKNASVLAFERKLCNSDALLYAGKWQERKDHQTWVPLALRHKDVRGTISNRLSAATAKDPLKVDAEIQKANLQAVDVVTLPFDADALKVTFTLRVLGNISLPCVCNEQPYQEALETKINGYIEQYGCRELALRYAENLANARYLWRNRIGAEEIEVTVKQLEQGKEVKSWQFNSLEFSLRSFSGSKNKDLQELASAIERGLTGDGYVFFEIVAIARTGNGQEVFPSQELVRENGNEKYKKSKVLYDVEGIAALHSQKVGNALRTVDTWYPQAEEYGPIAVEPYGSVTSRGVAYRQPKAKMDFYTLLDGWILKDNVPDVEQQHYVVACLIRGGVFGEKGE